LKQVPAMAGGPRRPVPDPQQQLQPNKAA
jgi:hypothetical protein